MYDSHHVFRDSKITFGLISFLVLLTASLAGHADNAPVNITAEMTHVVTLHGGKPVRIMRNQNTDNTLPDSYALTSRPCPPFCIQPMRIAAGVETIGELELLDYLRRIGNKDDSLRVIDSREAKWTADGMIPGAIHIPWTALHPTRTSPEDIASLLQFEFGAIPNGPVWDFNSAKTLVLYCNGAWCGQSPSSIRALLAVGYPVERIKWYRGGMQSWLQLGLTVVKPAGN
jgi:rhodanese-related sulfurtransferase